MMDLLRAVLCMNIVFKFWRIMKTNFLVIMAILVIAFGSCESDEFIEKKERQ